MTMNYMGSSYANSANAYKNQQVLTASPAELTLLLYNGALKFANEAKKAMIEKDYEKANEKNIKVQKIISELSISLDMKYDFAADWARLYEFISYNLIQANIKRDEKSLDQAIEMIRDFRNMWIQIIKTPKEQPTDG